MSGTNSIWRFPSPNQYLILMHGESEGCDYTLGCNISYNFIKAHNIEEAKRLALKKFEDDLEEPEEILNHYKSYREEYGLKAIMIMEINQMHTISLESIESHLREEAMTMAKIEEEKKEREELERLKKKYE